MTNVRKLNQDDVLGVKDEELSPSEFGGIADENPVPQKKKSLMPVVGGIAIGLAIIGFFGWKIAAPYFADRGGANSDAFVPIAAAPKPFEPPPNEASANGQEAPAATLNLPPIPTPQNSAAAQSLGLLPAGPAGNNAQAVVQSHQATTPLPGQVHAVPEKAGLPTGLGADEIVQINKRIDGITASLDALKEAVAKLQQQSQTKLASPMAGAAKTAIAAPAQKPKPVAIVVKKIAPAVAVAPPKRVDKPIEVQKPDVAKQQAAPAPAMQLQAVLQDRAWFKASTGETFTVSPGEELKGVGIVQQIDADSGRVVFTNGQVYR